jgi:hypothetical protein
MKAPSRKAGLLCLLLFVLGVIGYFIPLGAVPYAGPVLNILNQVDVYLLVFGYGLLLLAVFVL